MCHSADARSLSTTLPAWNRCGKSFRSPSTSMRWMFRCSRTETPIWHTGFQTVRFRQCRRGRPLRMGRHSPLRKKILPHSHTGTYTGKRLLEMRGSAADGGHAVPYVTWQNGFSRRKRCQMLESFRKLKALEGDYRVLPGHNEESTLSFEKEHNPTMRGL